MKIHADNWQEALDYFLDPRTVAAMARLGLHVERMEWQTQTVHIRADEGIDMQGYLKSLSAISASSTRCTPAPLL
jgi:hypothetical protein